jgi:hypothetical protein
MAVIDHNPLAGGLAVEQISKAARVMLFDAAGNPLQKLDGAARASTDGVLPTGGLNDGNYRPMRTDRIGSVAQSANTVLLSEPFEGATQSIPSRFTRLDTTVAPTQAAATGWVANPTNLLTSGAATLMTTVRAFPKLQRAPLHLKARARCAHAANTAIELGFGAAASQTVSPGVGAFFQVTPSGTVQACLAFNGAIDVAQPLTLPIGWQSNFYVWDIIADDDDVKFFVQDTNSGFIVAETSLTVPLASVRMWAASRLQGFWRWHLTAATATVANLIVTSFDVVMLDANIAKPWAHTAASMGLGAEVSPTTMAQVANYANSLEPVNATLSNTVPGYTTLGGQFAFAAPAGAVTDFALFGFTVPVGYSFVCTGIEIDTITVGAAVATTATVLQWALANDSIGVSLATGTNRRTALGMQSFVVGAAIGAQATPLVRDLSNGPLVTHGGRSVIVAVRVPIGTATASQVIRGTVALRGYFE